MNVILGDFGIVTALAASIVGIVVTVVGLVRKDPSKIQLGARLSWLVFGGALFSFVILERALITRDFSVLYVASNGSTRTAPIYNFATAWSSLEGSILLWGLILAGYVVVVMWKFRDKWNDPLVGWALVTMLAVCVFFFGLMAGPADPFQEVFPVPTDGPGPNPLLQNNVLMAFHPPMLYLGYIGFTVPFAFAIGALVTGRLGEGWLLETRRWSLFAWAFLTIGILLGAWWAYDVLGWGGYWGWDPVENASLLPWLTGTAYLHSVLVQERRGMLRVWNLSLVCATFALTILGTFLTRSGVVESVHAFSTSGIGPLLLGFFGVIVAVTVGLIGWRGELLRSPGRIDSPVSREGSFLANNLIFAVFAFVVLLGTVFPLVVEALRDEQLSVGTPYFSRMTMPLGLMLLFLMAIAPVLPWRKAGTELLRHRLQWPAWVGAGALVLALAVGARGFFALIAFFLGGFAAGAALRQVALATRRNGWRGFVGRTNGGMIVHLGVIMIGMALAASNSYLRQAEFKFEEGQTIVFADQSFSFEGMRTTEYKDRIEIAAVLDVDGQELAPAISNFIATGQPVPSPATRSTFTRDTQVSMTSRPAATGESVVIKITVQPLISWLWMGGLVMAIGTALAAFPTRFQRKPTDPVSAPVRSDEPVLL